MNKKKNVTVILVLAFAAGCSTSPQDVAYVPPMDPTRKVSEQDCTGPIAIDGNLMCREITERERRAKIAEEERQARARREAEERAEQLAREEAERQQRAAEEERLAAERRRLEAEAARKAQEERERLEKAAQEERERRERAEAEARARQLAEQQAREAAERECRRLEQERLDGRALLVNFVDNYGKVEENKVIAGQITTFLNKPRKAKPCPPAVAVLGELTKE